MLLPRNDIFLRNAAWEFILDNKIDRLPVEPAALAASLGYKVLTYNELALRITMSVEDIKVKYSKFGFVFWSSSEQKYIICYNNLDFGEGTIRWTLMHEIAHIALGHISKSTPLLSRQIKADKPLIEKEADGFARRVLCPSIVLHAYGAIDADSIMKLCGISKTAAAYRAAYMCQLEKRNMFLTSPLEKKVFNQFKNFK